MDQLKDFLRQCVKYRFWIAFGISLLLPAIGYVVGSGAINAATATQEAAIKGAKGEIGKYSASNLPNAQYKPLVDAKKEVLAKDVDATWRKLYAIQEPLLKWPAVVEESFRKWGRKWPADVDRAQVQQVLFDYTGAYHDFVTKVYQTVKPWNPETGEGVVYVPDQQVLLSEAGFDVNSPPDLGRVWAEQERLWVATALLDVVAKVNDAAGATDWDKAIIKQILLLDVGTPSAEDQKSLAKGVALEPAPPLTPDGAAAPPPAAAAPTSSGDLAGMGMGGAATKVETVYSLKSDAAVSYKVLPVRITVLIEQSKIPEFLVGLENSPMAIQVMEPEISRPSAPVVKPVFGETSGYAQGMMGGMMGPGMMGSGDAARAAMGRGMMQGRGSGSMMSSEDMNMGMMGGRGMNNAPAKKGIDLRNENKAKDRADKAKKDAAKKPAVKKAADPYFNIVELTVYGQARFYNTPTAPPAAEPSQAQPSTPQPAEPAKPETTPAKPADEPAKAELPKGEVTKPAEAPKPGEPVAKPETPAPGPDAPKAETPAPKAEPSPPKP